jgi:hypothetical protein
MSNTYVAERLRCRTCWKRDHRLPAVEGTPAADEIRRKMRDYARCRVLNEAPRDEDTLPGDCPRSGLTFPRRRQAKAAHVRRNS